MTAITQDEQRRMKVHAVQGGGGLRLHVREWGTADGPAILFIHGWSQNHLCWARQYESELTGEFRLVAYDLRGHGMSEAPLEPGHYTDGKLWADDVAAIIEELGLDQPVLVGWSYGAFVICDNLAAREIDCDDVLTAMQVPLLVTQGRADSVVLPAMAEHVLATCPTAEASWYDGTGHVPHLEDPGRFNRELAELTRHAHS